MSSLYLAALGLAVTLVVSGIAMSAMAAVRVYGHIRKRSDRKRAARECFWMPIKNPPWMPRSEVVLLWVALLMAIRGGLMVHVASKTVGLFIPLEPKPSTPIERTTAA